MTKKNHYNPFVAADWLRSLRKNKGLTQLELATELGVSERQIRRYETDGIYNIDIIIDIANYFDTDALVVLINASSNTGMQDKTCMPYCLRRQ